MLAKRAGDSAARTSDLCYTRNRPHASSNKLKKASQSVTPVFSLSLSLSWFSRSGKSVHFRASSICKSFTSKSKLLVAPINLFPKQLFLWQKRTFETLCRKCDNLLSKVAIFFGFRFYRTLCCFSNFYHSTRNHLSKVSFVVKTFQTPGAQTCVFFFRKQRVAVTCRNSHIRCSLFPDNVVTNLKKNLTSIRSLHSFRFWINIFGVSTSH